MVSFEEALSIITRDVQPTGTERVSFRDSLHRVLAEDVRSDIDMPPFDKAAMDGYACRRSDLELELEMLGVIAAGDVPVRTVEKGQCTKIMTGGMVPPGADTVIMVEQTEKTASGKIRFTGQRTRANIARKGEEIRKGELAWSKGTLIEPQHIAMLSAVGHTRPLVAKRPRVAILSTGDELVEPHQQPGSGKIRNSNGFQLEAQVRKAHCIPHYMGIVPDDEEATRQALEKALAENEVVILSGGVSAGDYDFVPAIMQQRGVEILFRKVAVKPGRPTIYGRRGNVRVFGLPGNPVSSFINFEVFIRPLLSALMGTQHQPLEISLPMASDFARKKADRLEFLPVAINDSGMVDPITYHGSAHIHAVCLADGLLRIPKGKHTIAKGEMAYVRPL